MNRDACFTYKSRLCLLHVRSDHSSDGLYLIKKRLHIGISLALYPARAASVGRGIVGVMHGMSLGLSPDRLMLCLS